MKNFKTIIIGFCMLSILYPLTSLAQMSDYKFKQLFNQAFGLVIDGSFEEAQTILFQLHQENKEHAQVAFLLGMCRVKIDDVDGNTCKLLQAASKNFSYYHQVGRVEDQTAPSKVWFYLAKALESNQQHEEAIEAYRNYMSCIPLATIEHKREVIFAIRQLKHQIELDNHDSETLAIQ